jgi:hypothetical protein
VQLKGPAGDGVPQVGFHIEPGDRPVAHRGVEDFTGRGAIRFGPVERKRGIAQYLFRPVVAGLADGDAEAGGREHLVTVHVERLLQCLAEPLGDAHSVAGIADVVEQHIELVPTEPRER